MLAVASNLFGKSSSLSAYTLHTSTAPSPASSSTNLPSTSSSTFTSKSVTVGLWKVVKATHKTTHKDVSVWIFEKRMLDAIRGDGMNSAAQSKEWVIEQLKKEATSLSRLRHPDILHMVEPLEESRTDLTFVTEMITSSLAAILSPSNTKGISDRGGRPPAGETSGEIDLDEVEIQKGTLQIAKGLAFLHQQAKMVHLNLSPDAILINAKGDWKLSGLSMTTPLSNTDGSAMKYVYPEYESRLPPQVQWKLDYLAPEYALDSSLSPANDLYSLGCVLYAVHMGGKPPCVLRGSMQSLREFAEGGLVRGSWKSGSKWDRCSSELKDLLPRLLTRHPFERLSLASLPSHSFFSSLAINTLNFLDATTFASKPREEKATFLRGLIRVLPTFSDRLRRGKILPSLLEEMKDTYLLPFILPNVFEISRTLSKEEFTVVLPKLQPLFALKDPPQNMLTLLEHLDLFEEKTIPAIFRENVMPLVYNSIESEHQPVQEKVLRSVPHLCEILDYGTVQNVLLVKVAMLFTRTRILAIKVQTLECFKAMVKTLDKVTLTTKLVPLLAKIKTKEPAVMMATLGVHDAMGAKVDREALATLVLPQLWAMSMGPLLNADQFGQFMTVIKSVGSRVEQEHTQHLRDVRRIEQQTATFANNLANGNSDANEGNGDGEVDFESLVKGRIGTPNPMAASSSDPWDMDGWAVGPETSLSQNFSILTVTADNTGTTFPSMQSSPTPQAQSVMRATTAGPSKLNARPVPRTAFNAAVFDTQSSQQHTQPSFAPSTPSYAPAPTPSTFVPLQPTQSSFAPLQPLQPSSTQQTPRATTKASSGPNYNVSLVPQAPVNHPPPASSYSSNQTPQPSARMQPSAPTVQAPPGWSSGLMRPTLAPKPTLNGNLANQGWDDFDPLK